MACWVGCDPIDGQDRHPPAFSFCLEAEAAAWTAGDVLEHEVREHVSGRVRDPAHPHPAEAAVIALDGDHDQRLAVQATPAPTRFHPADKGFVDLDRPAQQLATGQHHRAAQLVQPRPRGLVAPEPEHPLQPERADPVSLIHDVPHRRKPAPQRQTAAVKDRPRRDRRRENSPRTCAARAEPPTNRRRPYRSPDGQTPPPTAPARGSSGTPARLRTTLGCARFSWSARQRPLQHPQWRSWRLIGLAASVAGGCGKRGADDGVVGRRAAGGGFTPFSLVRAT